MLCLDITCLCVISFLLKDFLQTEQNQLMSTSQEQNVDREKGRMLRIYIGLLLLLPPSPPPPHFYRFLHPSAPLHFYCFLFPPPPPPLDFYIFSLHHYHYISIVYFFHHLYHISIIFLQVILTMSQVVKKNRGFLQLLAVCPAHQRQFLLRTATPRQTTCIIPSLTQGTQRIHSHPRRK